MSKRVANLNVTIEKPINVFVSSSQDEFLDLRDELKKQIDAMKIGPKQIFQATLLEKKQGESIQSKIDKGLDSGSIYVVIVGKKDTSWTLDEFEEARIRALPILIYDCRKLSKSKGKGNLAKRIERLKKKGVIIQNPPESYKSDQDFINHVIIDLPEKLGEIAERYLIVRKTVVRKQRFAYT